MIEQLARFQKIIQQRQKIGTLSENKKTVIVLMNKKIDLKLAPDEIQERYADMHTIPLKELEDKGIACNLDAISDAYPGSTLRINMDIFDDPTVSKEDKAILLKLLDNGSAMYMDEDGKVWEKK